MAKNHREWLQDLSLTNMTQSIIPELRYYIELLGVTQIENEIFGHLGDQKFTKLTNLRSKYYSNSKRRP
jgi:hypothetical protein